MKNKVFLITVPIIILACAAYFLIGSKNSEPQFRPDKDTRGNIISSVTATGTVNAGTTVLVGTQVSGTIKTSTLITTLRSRKGS